MNKHSQQGVVLIVDDTAESLTLLNDALSDAGYTVLVAMDGQQALNIATRMPPDLVIMDALMPNLNGFETCEAFKASSELQDIPVIFITGLGESEDVVRGLKSGGVDYLTKPVKIDELLARVEVHLDNARKTLSARGALNEMGQAAFSCNLQGELLWSTRRLQQVLQHMEYTVEEFEQSLADNIAAWLAREPEKQSQTRMRLGEVSTSFRLLGQPCPGEYLLNLIGEDDSFQSRELTLEFALTEREGEVLLWLSRGKSNQDIATILSMSPRTVNKHLEAIFRKLGVENRTAAAAASLGFLSGVRLY